MQTKPLTSSENNFSDLLNFIADPAVIVNEKDRILLVNNAFEDFTGVSPDNVIDKVFLELDILNAESKALLLENLKKRMQGLSVKPYEISFRGKSGKISLESTFGKGTTVTITIPVNPKPTDAGEEKWIFNESLLQALSATNRKL